MRLITVLPCEVERVAFYLENISLMREVPSGAARLAQYYGGIFADKVAQRGLDEQEDCAFSVSEAIEKGNITNDERAALFAVLNEFAYQLGWCEADAVFAMKLIKYRAAA